MFYCRLCNFKTPSLPRHLLHHKFHRNIHNYVHCGFEKCLKFFKKEAHLKKHLFRSHNLLKQKENPKTVLNSDQRGKFVCSISSCEKDWDCFSDLVKHLKVHIKKNDQITCPMHDCGKKYKVLSSFTSHLTKQHRNNYKKVQDSKIYDQSEIEESQTNSDSVEAQSLECVVDNKNQSERFEIDGDAQSESPVEQNPSLEESSDLYLHNLAQFYLKLETQLLLSASTVKTIVTEITSMQRESQNIVMTSLARKLISEGISADKVDIIVKEIINEDPFLKCNVKLGSNYKRKKFYKENFDFIQPESLVIDKENQTYFSYVPIIETLKYTFQDKSIQHEILKKPEPRDKDVLFDFMDGTVYKCNTFFNDNPDALKIILYQDAFEVVNPIGAAKKKHKILAVYMSIGNLPENLRSHVNTIKLVALCKEIDFDCQKVYGKIVEDLKIIETTGIEVGEKLLKGSLVHICGDNLGSHSLGGFTENFSRAKYICRFCNVERTELEMVHGVTKTSDWRTVASYANALEQKGNSNDFEGIKFDSVFNQLQYYHVCSPGLPPCIGHDLFEGIITYDLRLFIDYLIQQKWFTLQQLNSRIDKFPYSIEDRQDKPCTLSLNSEKITGGAVQIWNFLYILPLLIEDKIKDAEDNVWQLLIILTEIVEIVCSSTIHVTYLPYLDSLICEYLCTRENLFPDTKMRPKHHYVRHYAKLILAFGPLIKVWTMRFESKHRFFKRCIRYLLNFINVVKSLSEKHELHQSLVRLGADIRLEVETFDLNDFQIDVYSADIINAIRKADLPSDIQECSKIVIIGTAYKKGNILALKQYEYQNNVIFGKICLLLYCNESDIFILFEILETEFIPYLRAYRVRKTISYECCSLQTVLHFKPMNEYNLGNMLCIKPRFGFVKHHL
ncbi:uncharacterized protein LOC100679989 isoform X1 [Nasonia vitripennis]|uniref:C2H2-type domain-containing protein n=1 Tax=Nasonia vitripennis TaxID=7425 RepID=A0A7M7TBZ2_NASVI|nr:uncharacterized protein LOC100679989 isoform X1 [Nasonia vitripennis]XP_031780304.1 uncharacterized protein LOC100679989 isoform X1 [Nasonia vitripennis]XP_032452345.1 uncharacterized protein LOC100679989 isoform X1 [Nasonia vitripennis]